VTDTEKKPDTGAKDSRKRTGDAGEEIARQFLEKKGFVTIERNWRCGRGEIDIIAKDDAVLVFIEVKTRRRDSFGDPEDWITRRKQSQIARTAMGYLTENGIENTECRFDVVTIDRRDEKTVVTHIEDAFWADARASWRMF
jgi:putative endonuclease